MLEKILQSAFLQNKMHNSWLIQGNNLPMIFRKIENFLLNYCLKTNNNVQLFNHPDFMMIAREMQIENLLNKTEKSQNNSNKILIEQIINLQSFIFQKPIIGDFKAAIIFEADLMNPSASAACLKLLEDTPNFTYIFLVTSNFHALENTIKSRCHILHDYNPKIINDKENNITEILLGNNIDLKLNFLEEITKTRESWENFAYAMLNLLAAAAKSKIYNLTNDDFKSELLDKLNKEPVSKLISNYFKLNEIIKNHIQYETEIKATTIVMMELFT